MENTPKLPAEPDPDPDPLICVCWGVHRSTLLAAIARDRAAGGLAALMDATRAGMGCGTCRMDLLALLTEYRERETAER